jgi:hypothetical protein
MSETQTHAFAWHALLGREQSESWQQGRAGSQTHFLGGIAAVRVVAASKSRVTNAFVVLVALVVVRADSAQAGWDLASRILIVFEKFGACGAIFWSLVNAVLCLKGQANPLGPTFQPIAGGILGWSLAQTLVFALPLLLFKELSV